MLKRIYLSEPWASDPVAKGSNQGIVTPTTKKQKLASKNQKARENGVYY
jgi:hypothetical protein